MDRISAPEQNRLLGRLADMLRMTEGQAAAPEFLPPQLNVMNLVRQLMLPSAETVEKMSYGDPLFRMPQQSRIPITTDKQYLADIAGMVPFTAPAARPSARAMQDLVREIQTTLPVGAVNIPQTPSVPRSDIGFYSQLESAVQPLQNKGTGQQYLAQIQKSAGVKPEEIQWTGLDTFLRGKQSVTKADIQDYLNANRVDVREVRLGEFPKTLTAQEEALYDDLYLRYRNDPNSINNQEYDLLMDLENRANEEISSTLKPKFSSYTLPGGESYREILLTLPQKSAEPIAGGKSPATMLFERDMMEKYKTDSFPSTYNQLSPNEIDRYEMLVREDRNAAKTESLLQEKRTNFRSSHYDQPNILAHMRVNDRVVDGKKTLFIEEIQSDWHQAGRKKGYGPQGVPDAPFKTSWHELTLKRAIQEASEKGYDQIAFTTGKTQAERYDLSKQVDAINYQKHKDGTFSLGVKGKNQVTFENNIGGTNLQNIPEEELSSVVGKDLAEKMIAGEGRKIGQTPTRVFEGLDLSVGGKGMEGFYDNILPKSLEKLGKKFDAKVGKTEMDGVEVWQMDITPQMRESVTTKGQPLFAIPAIGTGLLGAGMMQEEEQF